MNKDKIKQFIQNDDNSEVTQLKTQTELIESKTNKIIISEDGRQLLK